MLFIHNKNCLQSDSQEIHLAYSHNLYVDTNKHNIFNLRLHEE